MYKQKIKSIGNFKEVYTREAIIYDKTRYSGNYGKLQLKGIHHAIDTMIKVEPNTKILDVATGTGVASLHLAEKGAQVTAMDLSEAMLKCAREKAQKSNIMNNITFFVGSAFKLPYKDNSFDVVTSIKLLHLMPNNLHKALIDEMFRVLKPGGTLLIEFKNGLYGGVLRILRKKEGYYLWPYNIKKLFAKAEVEQVCGYYLPGQQRIIPMNNFLHRIIEIGGHCLLIKYFYDKIYIKATKSL